MPITDADIRLLKSERLTDADDGGGRITGNEVVDGQSNNLFADVSDLDRTVGRVSLRKAYPAVVSLNTDAYLGVHAIIDDAPDDPNVSAVIFTTGSWTDDRADARDQLERFVVRGPLYPGFLYDTQIVGARAITLFQSVAQDPPAVGDVLSLINAEGTAGEQEQYIRLTAVEFEDRTFTDASGSFQRRIVTCEISDPLRVTFAGAPINRRDDITPTARVRQTLVADAARYYGVSPTVGAAAPNDLTVQVTSITAPLVPSAQGETPVVNAIAGGEAPALVAAGPALTRTYPSKQAGGTVALYLSGPVMPGSVMIQLGGTVWTDSGRGTMVRSGVDDATIDYATGAIRFASGLAATTGTVSATFVPAASLARVRNSISVPITLSTRGYNYVSTLAPVPAPGNLVVDYLSGNRWYRLRDLGNGTLAGSSASIGAGSINYATGALLVTLGALPDVGSDIIVGWSTGPEALQRAGDANITPPDVVVQIAVGANESIVPGSVAITWASGGAKSATANAAGVVSGDATGVVVHATGELRFRPASLPASNTTYTISFERSLRQDQAISAAVGAGNVLTFTLTAPVRPGSVRISGVAVLPGGVVYPVSVVDNGSGALTGDCATGSTINYSSGQVSIVGVVQVRVVQQAQMWTLDPFANIVVLPNATISTVPFNWQASVTATWVISSAANTAGTQQADSPALSIDLLPNVGDTVAPGSARFDLSGNEYVDRGDGRVVRAIDAQTDAGTLAGTIDYNSGLVTLTNFPSGAASFAVRALVSEAATQQLSSVSFRVPGAPLRPGSVFVQAVSAETGETISATAALNGTLSAAKLRGTVDVDTGVVRVEFGQMVPVAGNEGQPWFLPGLVVGSNVFRPHLVVAGTIRYNAVIQTYLPLSASLLGLDPVRLPQDGRVPIYRPGEVAVVHNTQITSRAAPLSNGLVINCGRTRLARVEVRNADGTQVPTSQYAADLDAGTVTLTNVTGMVPPLAVEHRVEDMVLVTDVQIDGTIRFARPLTHTYPSGSTLVSSALAIGDLQARGGVPFAQQTWTNVWSDDLIGSAPVADYNAAIYPIEVSNAGAIQERWALIFVNTTTVRVVGEYSGDLGTLPIVADIAPINPVTGQPYFTLRALGWGAGWASGNVLRFNTAASNYPLWFARTVLQGPPSVGADKFRVQVRGNAS